MLPGFLGMPVEAVDEDDAATNQHRRGNSGYGSYCGLYCALGLGKQHRYALTVDPWTRRLSAFSGDCRHLVFSRRQCSDEMGGPLNL